MYFLFTKSGDVVEFTINDKTYFIGRKPKQPQRETIVVYDNGYLPRGFATREKSMSKERIRKFAKTPYCRRAINIIKNGILSLPWVIEKRDLNNDNEALDNQIKVIENCISNPNNSDTYRSLIGTAIEDVLTGDCGAIEVCVGSDMQRPIWLYPVDGYSIKVATNFVTSPTDIKYIQNNNDGKEVKLQDQELIYMKMNDFSYTPLGLSPIESAFNIICYLLDAQRYAGEVANNAVPKYILDLGKDIDEQTLVKFRKYFNEEVYGKGEVPIVGGSDGIKSCAIAGQTDDNLYLKWQHFLISVLAYSFGIDPKRFNEGSQTDRSTVDEQRQNLFDEAIKPMAEMIAEHINKKVIGRLNLSNAIKFRYVYEDSETRKKERSDRVLNELNADILTINEARMLLGYDKLEGNDLKKYGLMLKSQYKTALNIEYSEKTMQDTGGFNGNGKNRYE